MPGETAKADASGLEKRRTEMKHAHDAIRIVFAVIMAVALKRAVETTFNPPAGAEVKTLSMFTAGEIAVFLVFLVTIARFFMGDMRHLDTTYLDPIMGTKEADPGETRPLNRFLDFYLLLTHGIIFFYMATSIASTRYFFFLYTFLILFNTFWLVLVTVLGAKTIDSSRAIEEWRKRGMVGFLRTRPPQIRWALNNTFFGGLFVIVLVYGSLLSFPLLIPFVALALANSAVDYFLTWEFYFPPFEVLDEPSPSD